MSTLLLFFLLLQIVLLFFITLHDWIHIPPLIDIKELEKHHSKKERLITSTIFFFIVFIPLALTWMYRTDLSLWVLININSFYGFLTLGTIFSWWIPYLFGSSAEHKQAFAEYKNTHHFLSARGDNVVPNTFHVIMHLQIWACFAVSAFLLVQHLSCTI